jgi:hypothetical protein
VSDDDGRYFWRVDTGSDGDIQIVFDNDSGEAYVSMENPWAGSTETGFGATTSITLTREQCRELTDFLLPLL